MDSSLFYNLHALNLIKQHESSESEAWINHNIGENYYYKEAYDSMEIYLFRAEQIATEHQLSSDIFETIYTLLGVYYYSIKSDIEQAINITQKSINASKANNQKTQNDSLNLIILYNNLGIFYEEKKSLSRASQQYEQALKLQQLVKDKTHLRPTLENYGRVQFSLGHPEIAIQYLQQGLLLNTNNQDLVEKKQYQKRVYSRLGKIYNELGQLDSANYFINQSIIIAQQNNLNYQTENIIRGILDFKAQKYPQALQQLTSIQLSPNDYSTKSIYHNHLVNNTLGQIYTEQKEYTTALGYYQKALGNNCPNFKDTLDFYASPMNATPYRMDYLVETLKNKAATLKAMKTPKSLSTTFKTLELAIHYTNQMRSGFVFEETKVRLYQNTKDLYQSAVEVAYELHQTTNEEAYLEAAFSIAEQQKGMLLLETLVDKQGKAYYNVPTRLLEKEQQLKTDIAFYKQKILRAANQEERDKYELYQKYVNDFSIQLGNLKDTLKQSYQTYFETAYQNRLAAVSEIQQNLLQNEQVFIEYVALDSFFYVFAIEKDNSHFVKLPYREEEKQVLVDFQERLRNPKMLDLHEKGQATYHAYQSLAYKNYQTLLAPITALLASNSEKLLIVPDGDLNYLSFEGLIKEEGMANNVDFQNLDYLIYDYQFHYGYSASLLLENQKQYSELQTNDRILAFSPSYEENEQIAERGNFKNLRSNFTALEGTAKEVQAISQYFKGNFHFGKKATKSQFLSEAKDFGILHLAMHGQPDFEEPDYARLVFSGEENKDRMLHHYEITNLESKAQLAVLSACETGVGKSLAGEGVMSLGRGFMYSGVPSVVMSLWKMNDQTTSELMPIFYKNLSKGMRKDEALHRAKLDYLKNTSAKNAYPFYWAGFIGIGDSQPLKKGSDNPWIWWLGGCLLIGFGLYLGYRRFSNKSTAD